MHKKLACYFLTIFLVCTSANAESVTEVFAQQIKPWQQFLLGQRASFLLEVEAFVEIDHKLQKIQARLERFDNNSFDLELTHEKYAVRIIRRANTTAFVLPKHKIVYAGKGTTDAHDHLTPQGIMSRLISADSEVSQHYALLNSTNSNALAILFTGLLKDAYDVQKRSLTVGKTLIQFGTDDRSLEISSGTTRVSVRVSDATHAKPIRHPKDFKYVSLKRNELERQLTRGVRRATEVLAPGQSLVKPKQQPLKVEHGELRWIDGHRVVLLSGTPEQIGAAHGKLLKQQSVRCIDSVLYSFGTAQAILTGKWFRHELENAYARLAPHIPERHKIETRAMAASLGLEPQLCETLNVFPELFHCSGFAVFGKATVDGTLYHGRVLDYMTTIGLQDAATTFIVAPTGKHAFANVGYAGFIGSVSGMNDQQISLGEMGGRGEGQWDGVPMATLMRRALEECSTLDEVMNLWKNSPRTCEYYYVFADGKTNRAVGVAAFPDKIEFIFPGQSDARIGEGIEDAVVISSGGRLKKLRERVIEKHGKIEVASAKWLMSRPVAMQSNLHNVLFIPAKGELHVANADHHKPAAECHYVKLNLIELLRSMPRDQRQATSTKPE